jgi:hypothetical protein
MFKFNSIVLEWKIRSSLIITKKFSARIVRIDLLNQKNFWFKRGNRKKNFPSINGDMPFVLLPCIGGVFSYLQPHT